MGELNFFSKISKIIYNNLHLKWFQNFSQLQLLMYLGYHNIEIKTRDILKLNFGIRANDWFLAECCVKARGRFEHCSLEL